MGGASDWSVGAPGSDWVSGERRASDSRDEPGPNELYAVDTLKGRVGINGGVARDRLCLCRSEAKLAGAGAEGWIIGGGVVASLKARGGGCGETEVEWD